MRCAAQHAWRLVPPENIMTPHLLKPPHSGEVENPLPTDTARLSVRLLPSGLGFEALPGESLLDAGQRAGFRFPQACRNGNCLRCEARLLAGSVRQLRTGAVLTAPAGGIAVPPCAVEAMSACELQAEGVLAPGEMPVLTRAAQVAGIDDLAPAIARVRLRLPAGKPVARLAGQYLEILDGNDAFAFSIASPPASGRDLELHVRHGEDNPSSLRVMSLLRTQAVVSLRLPLGDCTLVTEPRLPLLFVAGSTGFAQVRAFVGHALAQGWRVPMHVYWGARRREDLYLLDELLGWQREHANLRVVPVLSTGAGSAGMRQGLVHEAVLADAPDFASLLVYACGSPAMVYAALDAFTAQGLPEERMFSDVFAWAPRQSTETS
jgi:CDP-4-dehydro-6-deoxyglucose reductase